MVCNEPSLPLSIQYHACLLSTASKKGTTRRLRDSCPQATIRNAISAMVKAQFDQFSLESQGLNASCEPMVNSHLCQFQIHRHHGVETRPKFMGSTFVESFEFPQFLLWMCFSCTKYTLHMLGKVKCLKCTAQLQLNQWDFLPHSKGNGMQQTILAALNFWICCFARFFIVLFGINFASYPSASSFRLSVCKQGVASVVAALFGLEASLTNMSRNEAWALGAPPRNKFSASLTSLTKTDCH